MAYYYESHFGFLNIITRDSNLQTISRISFIYICIFVTYGTRNRDRRNNQTQHT